MDKMDELVERNVASNRISDYLLSASPTSKSGGGSPNSDFDVFLSGVNNEEFGFSTLSPLDDQTSQHFLSDTGTSYPELPSHLPASVMFSATDPPSISSNDSIQGASGERCAGCSTVGAHCQMIPNGQHGGLCMSCAAGSSEREPGLDSNLQAQSDRATDFYQDAGHMCTMTGNNVAAFTQPNGQFSGSPQTISAMGAMKENIPFEAPNPNQSGFPAKIGARFSRESVQILRKWLSLNRRHPYPSEEEKVMLQHQTGLSKTQISNWLANARRRKIPQHRSTFSHTRDHQTASIDVPRRPGTPAVESSFHDMDPLMRWVDSPPENEPASVMAIARAVAADRETGSGLNRRHCRDSTDEGSTRPLCDPSSASSAGTVSDTSRASAYSQTSDSSLNVPSSGYQVHRRRRKRRAPPRRETSVSLVSWKPYQCTFCTEMFRTKHDWQRHEKSLHLSLEKWICTCDGPYVINPKTNQTCCVFCGKTEPDEAHLESHNHSACKAKPMEEKTFYRKDHLNQHLKLVHDVQFLEWSMRSWKTVNADIRSRCGFCGIAMSSWMVRVEHLAEHFKCGSTIADWKGDWGFEEPILNMLENAIPPYLIEMERISPFPFIASCAPTESPRTAYELITLELSYYVANYQEEMGDLPTDDDLQLEACRIIFASEVSSMQGIAAEPSWLRDLFMGSKQIAMRAQFAALRRDVENKLCILKINGKDNLFEQCPLERQLHEFVRTEALLDMPITDGELQKQACDIMRRSEKASTSESGFIADWISKLALSSTGWLAGFRQRAKIPTTEDFDSSDSLNRLRMTVQASQPQPVSGPSKDSPARGPGAFENLMKKTFFLNDANCYRRLAQELTRFVLSSMSPNNPNPHVPTDAEIQHQARWILFDCDDPWNQTAADNHEWLQRFKNSVGILGSNRT